MTILILSYSLHLVEHFFTFQVALGKFFHPFLSGGGTFKVLLSKCHLRYLTQKNITFFCPFLTEKIRIFEKYFGKGLGRDYLWPTLAIRVTKSKRRYIFWSIEVFGRDSLDWIFDFDPLLTDSFEKVLVQSKTSNQSGSKLKCQS